MEEKKSINHSVIIENRNKFTLSGIEDVISFDDETVVTKSVMGKLVIKGENLRMINFDNSSFELFGNGKIHAIVYTMENSSGGFFSKLFRWYYVGD